MTKETAVRASNLLTEISDLVKYKKLLEDKEYGHVSHFEFVQHYGQVSQYQRVPIGDKHTKRMLVELEKIISELEAELESLK